MGEPTAYYVDPAIAADSGAGTIGDPYGDLQFALNSVTRNSSDGDIFHIKAGTDEVLAAAISLTTYGTPNYNAPIIFAGYASVANDGGIGGISGAGSFAIISNASNGLCFKDLHLHNSGAATILTLANYSRVVGCEIDNTSGGGIVTGTFSGVLNSHIHNCGALGVSVGNDSHVAFCYFKNGTNDFTNALQINESASVYHNIFSLDGTSIAIRVVNYYNAINHNSLFTSGTGNGINLANTSFGLLNVSVVNNLIEGFNNGIVSTATDGNVGFIANNSAFDCTTAYSLGSHSAMDFNNETLVATPFAKSGSDTYANRATYFAPDGDVGNVASPYGGMGGARGAVQFFF